ncbi:SHOCT domain-containing protein [Parasphingopyxis marina]|nr:SHOCT domain-containing protein [Parasphingopyxis marina]
MLLFRSLPRAFWLIAIAGALLAGLAIATAGIALYPPLANVAAPLVCDGVLAIDPGESGLLRSFSCLAEGRVQDVSLNALLAAFLVYSAAAFALILPLLPVLRRRPEDRVGPWEEVPDPLVAPAAPDEAPRDTDSLHEAARGGDISAILSLVADAVKNGKTGKVSVRHRALDTQDDGDGEWAGEDHDAAARLAELRDLLDRDLITQADFQAKKAEILDAI